MDNAVEHLESQFTEEQSSLVFRFSVTFARFEFALKRSGYVGEQNGRVYADWTGFACSFEQTFDPSVSAEAASACAYYQARPPKQQILDGGRLSWSAPQAQGARPLLLWLTRAIGIVRNNLFHGGKFSAGPIAEPARNMELMRHGVVILKAFLPLDPRVEQAFLERE